MRKEIKKYVEFTRSVVAYPKENEYLYVYNSLIAELAEYLGKLAKFYRDYFDENKKIPAKYMDGLINEIGDIYWMACRLLDYKHPVENNIDMYDIKFPYNPHNIFSVLEKSMYPEYFKDKQKNTLHKVFAKKNRESEKFFITGLIKEIRNILLKIISSPEEESIPLNYKRSVYIIEVSLTTFTKLWGKDYGFTWSNIINTNVDKLTSRKERGVIQGSGDDR